MRVLMVSRGVLPIGRRCGGAELVAFELARGLAARGDQVVLVSDVDESLRDEAPGGVSFVEVGAPRLLSTVLRIVPFAFARWVACHIVGNVRAARRAGALLGADPEAFDVVHCHGALALVLTARRLAAARTAPPLLYTEHDSSPWSCPPRGRVEGIVRRAAYRAVNLRASRTATSVITNFAELADELATRTHRPRAEFAVIPNGALDAVAARTARSEASSMPDATARYCLFVGSLVARKGPDRLMRALARVPMDCVFVGDGPLRADLERLAAREGLAGRVVFTGALEPPEVRGYYEHADVLVLPSSSEGVPLVALEALGAGVPVIASRLQGLASVVRDGVNGLLVEPGDDEALAEALATVEQRGEVYSSLRRNAASAAPSIPGWRAVSAQLGDVYERECAYAEWRGGAAGGDGATIGQAAAAGALGLPRAMVELWALGGVGA